MNNDRTKKLGEGLSNRHITMIGTVANSRW